MSLGCCDIANRKTIMTADTLTLETRGVSEYVRTEDLAREISGWLARTESTYHDLAASAGVSPRAVNKVLYRETEFQSAALADRLMHAMGANLDQLRTVLRRRYDRQTKTPRSQRQAPTPAVLAAPIISVCRPAAVPLAALPDDPDHVRLLERISSSDQQLTATEHAVALLREHHAVERIASRLAEHGFGLRVLPAEYGPAPRPLSRTCDWLWPEDEEGPVINVGVSERSEPEDVVLSAAYALAGVIGVGRGSSDEAQAMRARFAHGYVSEQFDELAVARHARALIRQTADAQMTGALDSVHTHRRYVLRAWATLGALSDDFRAGLDTQLEHCSPTVVAAYRQLMSEIRALGDQPALDAIQTALAADSEPKLPQLTRRQDPTGKQTAVLRLMAQRPAMPVTYQWMHEQLTAEGFEIPRPDHVRVILRRMASRGHIESLPRCRWRLRQDLT
jgi:hypothetical protein